MKMIATSSGAACPVKASPRSLSSIVHHQHTAFNRPSVSVCAVQQEEAAGCTRQAGQPWHARLGALTAAVGTACLMLTSTPAYAGLNEYEAALPGEFDKGSSRQYGEADLDNKDLSNQDLRRSNFTSASLKKANLAGANLQGAYFMKAVLYKTDFTGADLDDTLMDRAVMNESILRNATLQRAVLTRSDLGGADIYGADFTNALVDKTQQIALCKYADGVNPTTGVSTRKSLGCGSMRRFKAMSPSNPDGPQVNEDEKEAFRKTLPTYRE